MRSAGNKIFVVLASVLVGGNACCAAELGIDVVKSNDTNSQHLDGITFRAYRSGAVGGNRLHIDPAAAGNFNCRQYYALAEMNRQLGTNLITRSSRGKREMFFKCCGRSSIASQFARGGWPAGIVANW